AVNIGARFAGSGGAEIGKAAGVAPLGADTLRRLGEFLCRQRKGGSGALGCTRASAQRIRALADGGQRRSGGFGAACDTMRCPLQLADGAAEFELQKFKYFADGIPIRRGGG